MNNRSTQIAVTIIVVIAAATFASTYVQLHPRQLLSRVSSFVKPHITTSATTDPPTTNATASTNSPTTAPTPTATPISSVIHLCNLSTQPEQYDYDNTLSLPSPTSTTPDILREYVQWHATQRKCLLSTGTFCEPDKEPSRILVWRCFTTLCGGVGDRMRGIRFMFLLSVATKRLFFIDWPRRLESPYPLTLALLPSFIDWRVPLATLKNVMANPSIVSLNARTKRLNRKAEFVKGTTPFKIFANTTDFKLLWNDVHVVYITNRMPRSSLHLLGDNPSVNLQALDRGHIPLARLEQTIMKLLFRPSLAVQRLAERRAPFEKREYIAAHARTGVDVGEGRGPRLGYISSHLKSAAQRLWKCARDIQEDELNVRIFLASDSVELKRYFIEAAANDSEREVLVKTEFRKPLHIDRKGSMNKVTSGRRTAMNDGEGTEELCVAFLDVFADIFALANAKSFVYYHSGFAATAVSFGAHGVVHELLGNDTGQDGECRGCVEGEADCLQGVAV